jgi:hypothetical protein
MMRCHQARLPSFVQLTGALLLLAPAIAHAEPNKDQCIDANTRAQDLRRAEKLIEAREALRLCAAVSCPKVVREDCTNRLDDLDAILPSITFEAKDGAGRDLSAVTVTIDDKPFVDRLDGSAVELDPGEHTFNFEAAGLPPTALKLVIHEADRGRRESVTIGPPPARPEARQEEQRALRPPPTAQAKPRLGTQRIVALTAGGVGVGGVVLGSIFGAIAMSKKSDAQKACPNACADQNGVNAWSSAKSAGNVSTVAFIVGGVGLAGGAVLWFTAKPEKVEGTDAKGVRVGIGPGSIQLKGTW